jgi:hypothetical protein
MANKVLLVFGNITFEENSDGTPIKAIVHSVECTMVLPKDIVIETGEDLVNLYDAYIIPSIYKGQIVWEENG